MWNFSKYSQAKEVLDHYQKYFFRSKNIALVAVIKDGHKFKIQIGVYNLNKISINNQISALHALMGYFDPNQIPEILPVPSEFEYEHSNCSCNKGEIMNIPFSSIQISDYILQLNEIGEIAYQKNIDHRAITKNTEYININDEILEKWFKKYRYGGFPVKGSSKNSRSGSLGAFFELIGFPGKIFAITNWHIFGNKNRLGSKVLSSYKEYDFEIGYLFWKEISTHREVAIVELNESLTDYINRNYNLNTYWELTDADFNDLAIHYGKSTGINRRSHLRNDRMNKIISTYASIRMKINRKNRVFSNQILIENYSDKGDSGSIGITPQYGREYAFGLNFGKDFKKILSIDNHNEVQTLSVANKLNTIFNYDFDIPQNVNIYDSIRKRSNEQIVSNFKLRNFKLLNLNIMSRPPQRRNVNIKDDVSFVFYNDNEVTLIATPSISSGFITKIDFKLVNTSQGNYRLCHVVDGTFQYDSDNYYTGSENLPFKYDSNKCSKLVICISNINPSKVSNASYIGHLPINKNILGLFNLDENDPCDSDIKTCPPDLNNGTPDHKDGSIIIIR